MSLRYVILKENNKLTPAMVEKIRDLELPTYEERFPIENEAVEVYFSGSFEDCYFFIQKLDSEIKDLFEIK